MDSFVIHHTLELQLSCLHSSFQGDQGLFQQEYSLISVGLSHAHDRQMQKSVRLHLHPLEVVAALPKEQPISWIKIENYYT
jgi:hypothetical protein